MTCHESNLRLLRAESRTPCILGKTFGCSSDGSGVWVSSCRGHFYFNSDPDRPEKLSCGYAGMRRNSTVFCPLPRDEDAEARPSRCVCSSSGPARGLDYPCAKPSGPSACVGDARGAEANARCCARPENQKCSVGWRACTWHADERIAWFHPVKTGTSFLLSLAHYANRQCLAADAASSSLGGGSRDSGSSNGSSVGASVSGGSGTRSASASAISGSTSAIARCKTLPEKADKRFLAGEKAGKCVRRLA